MIPDAAGDADPEPEPLDPMSNEEFTSQLTQFSMLEQLESVNANLTQDMIYSQS